MFNALIASAARLLRELTESPPEPARPSLPVPSRPARKPEENFAPTRGAILTTQAEAKRHLLRGQPGLTYDLAGVLWPAQQFLQKLIYVTGKPGSGKTTMQKLAMKSCAELFTTHERTRWVVLDPKNEYLPFLYRILPEDVPIIRVSPHDLESSRWNIAKDVDSMTLNEALQLALFPDSKSKSDPFWTDKGRTVSSGLVDAYHYCGSPWQFHDLIIPFRYPQFLRPVLLQCPRTSGLAEHELVGRLGRDICSTTSATINKLATAAALWRHATNTFSISEFLNQRAVIHLAFSIDMIASLSSVANLLTAVLSIHGLKRLDELNQTIFWMDEGKYLSSITAITDIAALGRASGMGVFLCTQAESGLLSSWGRDRTTEFLELISTWVTFSAGLATAESFCKSVGQIEGVEASHSHTHGVSYSTSVNYGTGSSNTRGGNSWSSSSSSNSGISHSTSTSFSSSVSYRHSSRNAVLPSEVTSLPLVDYAADKLCGFASNPETGCFSFKTSFRDALENLPPAPFTEMPVRPSSQQILEPWTLEDLKRLNLGLTPDLMKALRTTWGGKGGVS